MNEWRLPKGITAEDELKFLRRRVRENIHSPSASTIIWRLLMKKPFTLEAVRSLADKESILDEAIATGNGDAILTVCKFVDFIFAIQMEIFTLRLFCFL